MGVYQLSVTPHLPIRVLVDEEKRVHHAVELVLGYLVIVAVVFALKGFAVFLVGLEDKFVLLVAHGLLFLTSPVMGGGFTLV